ncbi:translation initiation factor IF-2 [Candidatus Peregrinibacteria bacterium HGW-Peregrinibacteria-1]|jgi:translation initiation factor IF-2|nr:MAG: translation initiation factor IF-2 [Candidatus Peregrinibacteria bacterium HGW-Peregrinibacteria-1]
MSIKISDLSEKLGLTPKELREKIQEMGFEISPRARVVEDELAELISGELSADEGGGVDGDSKDDHDGDVVELYDEIIAQEREREIVKSQRKKMAGKVGGVKKSGASVDVAVKSDVVEIADSISVKEFAEKTGIKIAKVIGELMKNGILANINQEIDFETAQIIAEDMGVTVKRIRQAAAAEEMIAGDISKLLEEDDRSTLEERPPVVCVMGHVDHGKTKLLDTIRSADVVAGESGGITQHIGAYQVEKKGKMITFLDTPGHEAFTAMRARGAKVTDIAIIVVAADEGIKQQTVEAINHAKDAGVPIIVAMNKMDKPNVNPDKVKGELAEHGLQPEEWGGTTVVVPVSAITGAGIDDLLDMILLTAEMENWRANPDREAVATVVEANLDHSLGPVATVLVNTGTLKIMNNVVVGGAYGRIKLMKDHNGKALRVAGPSTPVLIAGLSETPKSGDILQVVKDEKTAKQKAAEIKMLEYAKNDSKGDAMSSIMSTIKSEKMLKIVVKADNKGSLEALKQSIAKIKDDEVAVKIIHSAVGGVTKSDVLMAAASNGMVMSFHAGFDSPHVEKMAERDNVEIRQYTIIYDLLEDIKRVLTGLLEPEKREVKIGRAEVRQIFLHKKKMLIVGCKVTNGKLKMGAKMHVFRMKDREEELIGEGILDSLRKVDDIVKEIGEGNDCGIRFIGDVTLEEGDILEAYEEEEIRREVV